MVVGGSEYVGNILRTRAEDRKRGSSRGASSSRDYLGVCRRGIDHSASERNGGMVWGRSEVCRRRIDDDVSERNEGRGRSRVRKDECC